MLNKNSYVEMIALFDSCSLTLVIQNIYVLHVIFYQLYAYYGKKTLDAHFILFLSLQDNKDARHVKTYEVALKDKDFIEGPWSQNNLDNGADLLIPVPPPFCGVLIIGEETIVYCSANVFRAIPIRPVGHWWIVVDIMLCSLSKFPGCKY